MESSPTYADVLRRMARAVKDPNAPDPVVIVHPSQWNGFIDVTHPSNLFARCMRFLGKKYRCFWLYKRGLKVYSFIGLKYLQEMLDE